MSRSRSPAIALFPVARGLGWLQTQRRNVSSALDSPGSMRSSHLVLGPPCLVRGPSPRRPSEIETATASGLPGLSEQAYVRHGVARHKAFVQLARTATPSNVRPFLFRGKRQQHLFVLHQAAAVDGPSSDNPRRHWTRGRFLNTIVGLLITMIWLSPCHCTAVSIPAAQLKY